METNKHYFTVGLFLLLTIFAIAIFSIWVAGGYDNRKYTVYRIHFTESVNGLNIGSPVKFRGVQVGKVETMTIVSTDTNIIEVDIQVLKSVAIKTDTIASLKLQSMTGGMYVELSGGSIESAKLQHSGGKNIPEIKAQTSAIAAVMDDLPAIIDKISYITDQAAKLLSNKTVNNLNSAVSNLHKSSNNVNELTEDLKKHPTKLLFKK